MLGALILIICRALAARYSSESLNSISDSRIVSWVISGSAYEYCEKFLITSLIEAFEAINCLFGELLVALRKFMALTLKSEGESE